MQNLVIPATARTPAIDLGFGNNHLKVSGKSYPEDVTEFCKPVFSALDAYLATLGSGSCRFGLISNSFTSTRAAPKRS